MWNGEISDAGTANANGTAAKNSLINDVYIGDNFHKSVVTPVQQDANEAFRSCVRDDTGRHSYHSDKHEPSYGAKALELAKENPVGNLFAIVGYSFAGLAHELYESKLRPEIINSGRELRKAVQSIQAEYIDLRVEIGK